MLFVGRGAEEKKGRRETLLPEKGGRPRQGGFEKRKRSCKDTGLTHFTLRQDRRSARHNSSVEGGGVVSATRMICNPIFAHCMAFVVVGMHYVAGCLVVRCAVSYMTWGRAAASLHSVWSFCGITVSRCYTVCRFVDAGQGISRDSSVTQMDTYKLCDVSR